MKSFLLTLLLAACLIMPAVAGVAVSAQLSTGGPGTPEIPPMTLPTYINDTKAASAERNWTEVIRLSSQGIAWYPGNADLRCLQGYAYRKMGYHEKAIEVVSQGILLDPKPVRYANRGYAYLALGNTSAALADAETGISLNPDYPTTYSVKAMALHAMGRDQEALSSVEKALAIDPKNAHYWHIRGILLASGRDCTGAGESFEKSIALDPDYSLPYPGFPDARGSLAALNTSCTPAPLPAPTKSPAGCGIAVLGIIGAFLLVGMRK